MKKRVLIICDLFPPSFGPRMGYLCKYLKQLGWEPVVLTEELTDETFLFLSEECEVKRVNFFPASNRMLRRVQWFFVFILDFLFGLKDARFYREAKRLYRKEKYDLVLCSTYRTFPLGAALKTAKRFRLPLISDLRDVMEQYTGNEFISTSFKTIPLLDRWIVTLFRNKSLRQRNLTLRHSDWLVTVSPWHVELLKQYNPGVSLIYNGFDPEVFYPEQIATDKFYVTYTGRILSLSMRDPSLLFEAVALLDSEKKIAAHDFRVRWFVDEASEKVLKEEAEKYGIADYMDFYGYVPANEVPAVLNGSSVLLLLTNKSSDDGPKGLMTTKFFESIAVKKPLLCVRSDESYLEQAIYEVKAGCPARTVDEAADFLMEKYAEWKTNSYTTSHPDEKALNRFSRKEQAAQFAALFGQVIK